MDAVDQLTRLGVALAVGLLVGVERGWRERDTEEGGRVAGLRTYGLVGLLGGVVGLVGSHSEQAMVIVSAAFVAVTGIILASASNTLVKGVLTGGVGGMALGKRVLPPLVLAALAGIVWVWLV